MSEFPEDGSDHGPVSHGELVWRVRQLESSARRAEKDIADLRSDIASERNWRFLVTGGIGAGSAFITWLLTTWGKLTGSGHP